MCRYELPSQVPADVLAQALATWLAGLPVEIKYEQTESWPGATPTIDVIKPHRCERVMLNNEESTCALLHSVASHPSVFSKNSLAF